MTPLKPILPLCLCGDPLCTIPYGYCHCGCGGKTDIATNTRLKSFRIEGVPYRFMHSHSRCKSGLTYQIEDRGYKTPCWIWQRHINQNGYGMMRDERGVLRSAYKVHYERKYGKPPKGMQLDHLCRQRACVNPDHFEQVTHAVNVARGLSCTITQDLILEVKRLLSLGMTQIPVAKQLGISQSAVSDIKLGRKDWRLTHPQLQEGV